MIDRSGKQSRQSSRTEPSQTRPLASQTRGSFSLCGSDRCCFSLPRARCGQWVWSMSAVWNICGLVFRAQVARSATPRFPPLWCLSAESSQSLHLQNAGTFGSGPGGCPHLRCCTPTTVGRSSLLHSSYFGEHLFYRSYLSKTAGFAEGLKHQGFNP